MNLQVFSSRLVWLAGWKKSDRYHVDWRIKLFSERLKASTDRVWHLQMCDTHIMWSQDRSANVTTDIKTGIKTDIKKLLETQRLMVL